MKMRKGDVFTLDQTAVDELKLEVPVGQQYTISQEPNSVEVRGSKIGADGRPQKGRPRCFPVALVARLLGEPAPVASTEPEPTPEVSSPAPVAALEARTEEEKTRSEEAVARASTPAGGQDW